MDGEVAQGPIGSEGKYEVKFVGLDLLLSLQYDGQQIDGSVNLKIDGKAVLEALKAAIPGKYDDVIISMIEELAGAQAPASVPSSQV